MASLTQWTWVWVNSRIWWWTGRPGVLQFMGSQRVGHDWVTELILILKLLKSGSLETEPETRILIQMIYQGSVFRSGMREEVIEQELQSWAECSLTWMLASADPIWQLWHTHSCFLVTQLCPTLCNPIKCSMPGFPVLHHLPELAQIHVYWVGDAIQPSHPLLSPSPAAFNLSQHQGLFQWISSSHQVAKELELQNHYQSFHEYSGLISFRIDGLNLLAVQGTLKHLLQHQSSKASILQCSTFFIVQLSYPHMTTGKTIA